MPAIMKLETRGHFQNTKKLLNSEIKGLRNNKRCVLSVYSPQAVFKYLKNSF